MDGQLAIGAVDQRVIQIGFVHPGLEVVAHQPGVQPVEELERAVASAHETLVRTTEEHRNFSGEVDFEHGNFDYLMGADVDQYDPEVREETIAWGKWFLDTTGVNGFRLDAVKHIPFSFFKDYLAQMREYRKDKELFAVGEYIPLKVLGKHAADLGS